MVYHRPQWSRYADLTEDQVLSRKSLQDIIVRALPFCNEEIFSQIKEGKRVLDATHGNSLQEVVKHLEGLLEDAIIVELNPLIDIPVVCELDKNLKPIKLEQFLGDEETPHKPWKLWPLRAS